MSSTEKDSTCKGLQRTKPNIVVTKEIANQIGNNFRTLPIFEKGLYEYTFVKHYSLQYNDFLKCNWEQYKKNIDQRVCAPFEFIDIRDYHFYKCRTRLIPSESVHTKKDFRHQLKPGPGVDDYGQMPIPQELQMKRAAKNMREENPQKRTTMAGKGQQNKNIAKIN